MTSRRTRHQQVSK